MKIPKNTLVPPRKISYDYWYLTVNDGPTSDLLMHKLRDGWDIKVATGTGNNVHYLLWRESKVSNGPLPPQIPAGASGA